MWLPAVASTGRDGIRGLVPFRSCSGVRRQPAAWVLYAAFSAFQALSW